MRIQSCAIVDRGKERAVAFAQQHRDVAGGAVAFVGHDEVRLCVAVEVAHRHKNRMHSGSIGDSALEVAIPLAQQNRDVIRIDISHDQVGLTIAVEIAHGQGRRTPARFKRAR